MEKNANLRISASQLWLLMIFILFVAACGKSQETKDKKKPDVELTDLQKAIQSGELYSLTTGDAYLVGDEKVYYISNNEAVLVKGLPSPCTVDEVYALADGSALLMDGFTDKPALYHLRQDNATKYVETKTSFNGKTPIANPRGFYFAEVHRLKRQLKKAEENLQNYEEGYAD